MPKRMYENLRNMNKEYNMTLQKEHISILEYEQNNDMLKEEFKSMITRLLKKQIHKLNTSIHDR